MALKERISGLLGKNPDDPEAPSEAPGPPTKHLQASETTVLEEDPAPAPEETPQPEDSGGEKAGGGIRDRVIEVLKTVYDPEIPVDIYELGLIYEIDIRNDTNAYIQMTLTTPMCPVAETLPPEVEAKVREVEGIGNVELELVWDPPWNPDMMSEAAKLTLNF